MGAPATHDGADDGLAAAGAGLAGPAIGRQPELVLTGLIVGITEIAQGRALVGHGPGQHLANSAMEPRHLRRREGIGAT